MKTLFEGIVFAYRNSLAEEVFRFYLQYVRVWFRESVSRLRLFYAAEPARKFRGGPRILSTIHP